MSAGLIEARGVSKRYRVGHSMAISWRRPVLEAVTEVSLEVVEGRTMGLVGESGCGKSTLARLILLLEPPSSGSILFEGLDTGGFEKTDLHRFRRSVQAVFQNPASSLNPRMRVRDIVAEPLQNARWNRRSISERVQEVLEAVRLSPSAALGFPHEFSGGQQQRIAIARAIAARPRMLVLDEPTTSLDVSVRAQLLNLFLELQRANQVTYLFIAHDLAAVRYLAHEVAVMFAGQIVERAPVAEVFGRPLHPYTRALLLASSVRPAEARQGRDFDDSTSDVSFALHPSPGCRFHARCQHAMDICRMQTPILKAVDTGHLVSCHLYDRPGDEAAHSLVSMSNHE